MPRSKRPRQDQALLRELRDDYTRFLQYWSKNWKQGDEDMRALSVLGPWPENERKARSNPDTLRPCEHFDIISQYNNRVVNQAALNPVGVKVDPTGDGANDETAQKREKRQRQISYESQAAQARLTAFQHAVDRGLGHWIVRVEHVSPDSFNQKIVIERIANPKSVLIDPDAKRADRSDMQKAFFIDKMSWPDFRRQYPWAEYKSFEHETMQEHAHWVSEEHGVMVAEYWRVEKTPRVLLLIEQLGKIFKDELEERFPDAQFREDQDHATVTLTPGGQPLRILKQRDSERCEVWQYITNGIEILEKNEWLGSTIPIPSCTGREKYEDDELVIESLTRKARAGQLAYDVAKTNGLESLMMMPKSKWVVADGQLEGFEHEWANMHRDPRAYARYKATTDATGQHLLPAPERMDYEPPIQASELYSQSAMRDVQNAVGMSSVETINKVSKSGIAQERIDQAADINAYHLMQSLKNAIAFEGRIVDELLDKIEDSERTVGFRDEDGTYRTETIAPRVDDNGKVIEHPYGKPEGHSVTISTGPDFESQREEASAFADLLIEKGIVALTPLAIKLKNVGPLANQMYDVALASLPPEIQAAYRKHEGEEQIPPEAQAQIVQLEQMVQQLTAALEEAIQKLETKQLEIESKEEIEAAKIDAERDIEAAKVQLEEARLELERIKIESEETIARMRIHADVRKTEEQLDSQEMLAAHAAATTEHESAPE